MNTIFYKKETGVLNPRDYKCDYFKLGKKSIEEDGSVLISFKFWRVGDDAVNKKPENIEYTVQIPIEIAETFPTVSSAVVWCFSQPELIAVNGKSFNIQGATKL